MRAGLHVAEHRGAAGRERDMRVVGTDLLGAETSRLYLVLANGVIRITSPQWLGKQEMLLKGWGVSRTHTFSLLKESVAKMGIASRTEIENWFTTETLGVSG